MKTITADMKVAKVIDMCPEAVDIFLGRGCPDMRSGFFNMMAHLMSVQRATRIHKIDLEPLLDDLNKAVQKETET
jgi:hypothetical protein